MIPPDELERFSACARDAWNLAAQGCVAEGYAVLDLGLTWAETPALNPVTGEESPLDPWAGELMALYRRELAHFLAEYRTLLGRVCLPRSAQFARADAGELRATAASICERSGELRQRATELKRQVEERARLRREGRPAPDPQRDRRVH